MSNINQKKTGFITNVHKDHFLQGHYERLARVSESLDYILENTRMKMEILKTDKKFTTKDLEGLYNKRFISRINRLSKTGKTGYLDNQMDTYFSEGTYEASTSAVFSNLTLLEKVLSNEITNGFALTRPPGHHSSCNKASGFCIFNTIAVLADKCTKLKLKPMIIDFDIHHGDGTEAFFRN